MKPARRPPPSRRAPAAEMAELRARLKEAEDTLRAIRNGEVDAVVVAGKQGPQVFTLEGAEHAYRVLIESMHEGALTLTADMGILYANQCFARMVGRPLKEIIGGSLRAFLSAEDEAKVAARLRRPSRSGTKLQTMLRAGDGAQLSVQVSIRPLPRTASGAATLGLVVTDMTEARRTEELLRALTHRVVRAQETERGSVALDLHDNITQLLCALLVRSQALADKLAAHEGGPRREAIELRRMLGVAAEEVERISRSLRPSVLEHLGLAAVLHAVTTRFTGQTGVPVRLSCVELTSRLAGDTEMALFRILEEAMKNVGQHAHARHVVVALTRPGPSVLLSISDDGRGFDPTRRTTGARRARSLGLLGMRERATSVGGDLSVHSGRGEGTTIEARVPFDAVASAPVGGPAGRAKPRKRRG